MVLIGRDFVHASLLLWLAKLAAGGLEKCHENLEWFEKYFVDDTQTFSLRICCNVTKIWLGSLKYHWRLEQISALNWVDVHVLSMPGFDLILSQCPGGQIILGEVTNSQCKLLRGNIATFSKGFDVYQLPEFDNWYITCVQVQRNTSRIPCVVCKLDVYCTTHFRRCSDKFASREIVNASKNAVTILLRVGDLPFRAEVTMEVRDSSTIGSKAVGASSGSTGHAIDYGDGSVIIEKTGGVVNAKKDPVPPHYFSTTTAAPNSSVKYEIDGLKLNSWYIVRTCLHVDTPSSFYVKYPDVKLPKRATFCLDDEGYQTQRAPHPRTKIRGGNSGSSRVGGSLHEIFLIYLFLLFVGLT